MVKILLLLIALCLPFGSSAQSLSDDLLGTQPTLVLFPSYPSPGQSFTVSLDDYSGGAYGAQVDWFINGVAQPAAQNNREITATAGEQGNTTTIEAVLTIQNGPTQTIRSTITPRYLDLIFEPQTHVPGFYKGRALPSQGSLINATALIHDTDIPTANLIYTWRVGNEVINGGPLRGQNKISFTMPPGRETIVTAEVTDGTGTVLARRSLAVPLVEPELRFYEVNTLYGVVPRALSSLLLIGNSATVRAVPFYLDSRVYNEPSVVVWELDRDEYIPETGNPYEITLQRVQNGGSSALQFHVRSTTNFLQGAKEGLVINY